METNRIVQFCALVETGNLRKAAGLLNISHSGLSKSMQVLQAELGVSLFQPSGRGVVITDEGQLFYERAQIFLEDFQRLIGRPSGTIREALRLGSFETFTSFFVGPLLQEYFPDRDVEIHELVPGRLEEALVRKKIDLGITYEPIPQKGVDYVKVTSLEMGAYAARGKFTTLELSDIPFIVPVTPLEGAPSGVKGLDAWPDQKIERNIRYRVDLMATGLELARQGLAAIFIPQFVAKLHNQRVSVENQLELLKKTRSLKPVKRDVYIVKREATVEDEHIRQIALALRRICG